MQKGIFFIVVIVLAIALNTEFNADAVMVAFAVGTAVYTFSKVSVCYDSINNKRSLITSIVLLLLIGLFISWMIYFSYNIEDNLSSMRENMKYITFSAGIGYITGIVYWPFFKMTIYK